MAFLSDILAAADFLRFLFVALRAAWVRCQANAGDSRCVLGTKGLSKPLSVDHKPNDESSFTLKCTSSDPYLTSPP